MKVAKSFPLIVAAALVMMIARGGACQTQTNFAGSIHLDAGFPQGELNDHLTSDAFGLSGQIFYSPQKSPFAIGLELGWLNYGSTSRREPFSSTIPDVTVDVETNNNIVQSFLVLRGQLPGGPLQFYGEGLVGLNYLYTETNIHDTGGLSENIASSVNQDDAAFAYGLGGGVTIPIFTRAAISEENRPLQVLFDCGVRYVRGGNAEYLKEGSIRREGSTVTFDTMNSKTDMLRTHFGVMFRF